MNTEKILLVDDERAIRLAVRTALTREGMQVTEAADGSEALELLKKQQFHLDLSIPMSFVNIKPARAFIMLVIQHVLRKFDLNNI